MDLAVPTLPADAPDRLKPWGTAHAVLAAKPAVEEPFAVINADDYYGIDGYKKMADFLIQKAVRKIRSIIFKTIMLFPFFPISLYQKKI